MSTISAVIAHLETIAPPAYQESYDNSGLICGDRNAVCTGIVVCLDSIESVIDEAIQTGANLVVAHHPIVFSGLKSLTGKNYIERTIIKAIKNDIAIYAIHTNLDNVHHGVNRKICDKLGLDKCKTLDRKSGILSKFIAYGTAADVVKIRQALFDAGAGKIGDYEECSYGLEGECSFKPVGSANPTIGTVGQTQYLPESRIEVLVPNYLLPKVLSAAKAASSYEEMAYDIVPLGNVHQEVGSGMVGEWDQEILVEEFLAKVKSVFGCGVIKYTNPVNKMIKRVAVCGGSGSFLLNKAMAAGADVFITADYKYHQFFDADGRIMIADIGHFESEQFTIELLADELVQKFSTFAVRLTSVNTNPVNYY
ncbi:MAG: Nif3-like dinuclear metal center hexameric protein [Bacteroidota bacterium]